MKSIRGYISRWASRMLGIMEPRDGSKTARTESVAWVAFPSKAIFRGEVKVRADFPEMPTFLRIDSVHVQQWPSLFWTHLTSEAQRLGNRHKVRSRRRIQIHICLTERVLWAPCCTLEYSSSLHPPWVLMALTRKSWWQTKQTLSSLSSFPRLLQNDSKVIKVQLIYKSKEKRRRTISHLQISVKF